MSEWISVDKYLPPFHKDVLAVIKHKETIGETEIMVCILSDEGEWMLSITYEYPNDEVSVTVDLKAKITHWMPLPELPE